MWQLYIGRTKRRLGDHFTEHLHLVRQGLLDLLVANHCNSPSHSHTDLSIPYRPLPLTELGHSHLLISRLGSSQPNNMNIEFSVLGNKWIVRFVFADIKNCHLTGQTEVLIAFFVLLLSSLFYCSSLNILEKLLSWITRIIQCARSVSGEFSFPWRQLYQRSWCQRDHSHVMARIQLFCPFLLRLCNVI